MLGIIGRRAVGARARVTTRGRHRRGSKGQHRLVVSGESNSVGVEPAKCVLERVFRRSINWWVGGSYRVFVLEVVCNLCVV